MRLAGPGETSRPDGALRLGVTVTSVDAGDAERRARVVTSAGELDADLVVAADGIGSRLRAALFPGHPGPRYSYKATTGNEDSKTSGKSVPPWRCAAHCCPARSSPGLH